MRASCKSWEALIKYVPVIVLFLCFNLMICNEANAYRSTKLLEDTNAVRLTYHRTSPYNSIVKSCLKYMYLRINNYSVIVDIPYISSTSMDAEIEWGVTCSGCYSRLVRSDLKGTKEQNEIWEKQNRLYSNTGLIDHIMRCSYAQALFTESLEALYICEKNNST